MDGFQSHRLLVELLTEPVELNRASRPPVSALRYDLTQVTQRQTVNRDRAIRLVGDSLNIRDNSLARDRRTLWRSAVHGSNGAATQIEQWREAVRTRNAAAAKSLPPSSICGWRRVPSTRCNRFLQGKCLFKLAILVWNWECLLKGRLV